MVLTTDYLQELQPVMLLDLQPRNSQARAVSSNPIAPSAWSLWNCDKMKKKLLKTYQLCSSMTGVISIHVHLTWNSEDNLEIRRVKILDKTFFSKSLKMWGIDWNEKN